MEYSTELYHLMLNLLKLNDKEEIMDLFIDNLKKLFIDRNIEIVEFSKSNAISGLSIETQNNVYGVLNIDGLALLEFEYKIFLQNAVQMLAVILENSDYKIQLTNEKQELENCSIEQVEQIKRSKIAALNLIEDLTNEIDKRKSIEDELRFSEERFRLALEATSEAVWDWNLITHNIYLSPRWYDILGYSNDSLRWNSDAWRKLIHPDDLHNSILSVIIAIRNRGSFEVEYRIKCYNDDWKTILSKGSVTGVDHSGKALRMTGTNTDITDRKNAEKELQKKAFELEALNELSTKINSYNDREKVIFETLKTFVKVTKCQIAFYFKKIGNDLVEDGFINDSNKHYFENIPEHKVGKCLCGLSAKNNIAIYSKDIYSDERCTWEECKKAGQKSFAALPITDGENVVGVIGLSSGKEVDFELQSEFLETITSHVSTTLIKISAFQQVVSNEEKFRSLAFNLPNIVLTTDLDGIIQFINHPLPPLKKEEVINKNFMIFIPESDRKFIDDYILEVRKKLKVVSFESQMDDKVWFNIRIGPRIINGGLQGYIFVCTDISDQKLVSLDLLEKEDFLRTIYNHTDSAIFVVDVKNKNIFKYVDVNEKHEQLFGISKDFIKGKSPNDLIKYYGADSINYFLEIFNEAVLMETTQVSEIKLNTGRWSLNTITPIPDSNGTIYRLVGSSIDITDRKKAEKLLAESESRYKTLINTAPYGIQMSDREGRILYSNPAHNNILGYKTGDLEGTYVWENIADEKLRDETIRYYKYLILETPKPTVYFSRDKRKDGRIIDLKIIWDYIFDQSGRVESIISIIDDITESKIAEEKLKTQASLFNQISDAIIITNVDFKIISWNLAAENIYGWKSDEVLGRVYSEVVNIEYLNNDREVVIEEFMSSGYWQGETIQLSKSKKHLNILSSVAAITDSAGEIKSIVAVNKDITDIITTTKAYHESEEKFKILIENSEEIVFMIAKDGNILLSEGKGLKALGLLPGELVGVSVYELYKDDKDILKGIKDALHGVPAVNEHKLGDSYFKSYFSPYREKGGNINGILGLSVNITDKIIYQTELTKYKEELENIVQERTAELEEKNMKLERMNNLFVGREFRIKELKEQLKKVNK